MLVTPAGGRLWHFRYKRGGVEKLLTLGAYPEVSLKRAREKRDDARRLLSDGVDPPLKRRAEEASETNTFKGVAAGWSKMMLDGPAPEWRISAERMKMREAHIVPLARRAVESSERSSQLQSASDMCFPPSVVAGVR